MVEKVYNFSFSDEALIEKIIEDENVAINHVVLSGGDSFPTHLSNSNVYMIILRGSISLSLNDQEEIQYTKGDIINIPIHTEMTISNKTTDLLEMFIVKSPSPFFLNK